MKPGYEFLKGVQYTSERDDEISSEVLQALRLNWQLTDEKIKVTVTEGCVTLDGDMPSNYQKASAEEIISKFTDVKSVTNNLIIQSNGRDGIAKMEIENALKRNWTVGHSNIHVHVSHNQVTLNGTVDSMHELEEAVKIASNSPDIKLVHNNLKITSESSSDEFDI